MADTSLAAFERRAAEAERRLAALELKLASPGGGGGGGSGGASGGDLRAYQKKVVAMLYDLRADLGRARATTNATERRCRSLEKDLEEARDVIQRKDYRILHLCRAYREAVKEKWDNMPELEPEPSNDGVDPATLPGYKPSAAAAALMSVEAAAAKEEEGEKEAA